MYYVPHTSDDQAQMLSQLSIQNVDELFTDIPAPLRNPKLSLKQGLDPVQLTSHMSALAQKNQSTNYLCFLGAGAYDHFIPPVVNTLVTRGEFYSAYTPYQPEMSQGLLQSIFEYQTMICEITGMDVSNASLYDGSTAIWEAILMAVRLQKKTEIILLEPIHPNYQKVIATHASAAQLSIVTIPRKDTGINLELLQQKLTTNTACIVAQYPNFLGHVEDLSAIASLCKEHKSLFVCSVNPMALNYFETPAQMGADIIVGEGQPLGVPLSFGGPYFGFLACKQDYLRQIPGRICGETTDKNGKRGFVLTIQTREQHIRREKATSNICTNQALLALRSAIYMSYMGPKGLAQVTQACIARVNYLKEQLSLIKDIQVIPNQTNFCEFVIQLPCAAKQVIDKALSQQVIIGYDLGQYEPHLEKHLLICATETKSKAQLDQFLETLKQTLASLNCAV